MGGDWVGTITWKYHRQETQSHRMETTSCSAGAALNNLSWTKTLLNSKASLFSEEKMHSTG